MPFDEEADDSKLLPSKKGLKQVSSQKSIFDSVPKKPSPQEFETQVKGIQEKEMGYKSRAADLSGKFIKILSDKTLKQNKSIFSSEIEKEILTHMIQLAVEINNDPHEQEGMGSMGWITLLLKISLLQRDRINQLEYFISSLEKKIDLNNKESSALDNKNK